MKNQPLALAAAILLIVTASCSAPVVTPTPTPTLPIVPPTASFTPGIATTQAPSTETLTPPPTFTPIPQIATTQGGPIIQPGAPSGPYAVILVASNDALNIRSGPGAGNALLGAFQPTVTNVMRTGPSALVDESLWVEVNNPGGGAGWVDSHFLTKYVAPSAFCADARPQALLQNFAEAIQSGDGVRLASLVSPRHGVDIWMWNSGNAINFDAEHARWVFESTYVHNWGTHPASGLETFGSFQELVLPQLRDTFVPAAEHRCNDTEISSYINTWPGNYANLNLYQVFRPGTPGVELDWNAWFVGVEYVNGNAYLFALIHFIWTP